MKLTDNQIRETVRNMRASTDWRRHEHRKDG